MSRHLYSISGYIGRMPFNAGIIIDIELDRVVVTAPILRRHLLGLDQRHVMMKMSSKRWHQEYVGPATGNLNSK